MFKWHYYYFLDTWEKRWIPSEHAGKEWGKFVLTPGKFYGDPEISKGEDFFLFSMFFIFEILKV